MSDQTFAEDRFPGRAFVGDNVSRGRLAEVSHDLDSADEFVAEAGPFVSVRGEALLVVEPEIATVAVTLMAKDSTPDEVLSRLRERSQRLSSVLDRFGEALEKVETAAVRVIPEFKDSKPNERITGYGGELRTTVTVSDFTHLGELVVQSARGDLVAVTGPWWSLRNDSPVFRRCRVLA
ncbi:MAG TPA: SIMPL domain-containing protein, partial [Acidimicrobiales bacterium]|nr:SIMPL domain-containing protein [Acidimicrobiales bacterium]